MMAYDFTSFRSFTGRRRRQQLNELTHNEYKIATKSRVRCKMSISKDSNWRRA